MRFFDLKTVSVIFICLFSSVAAFAGAERLGEVHPSEPYNVKKFFVKSETTGTDFLMMYKGKFIALQQNGTMFMFSEPRGMGRGEAIAIQTAAVDMASDGTNLYVMTARREFPWFTETRTVSVFRGAPGVVSWSLSRTQVQVPCSGTNTMCSVPQTAVLQNGRELTFEALPINNAKSFKATADGLFVERNDGKLIALTP